MPVPVKIVQVGRWRRTFWMTLAAAVVAVLAVVGGIVIITRPDPAAAPSATRSTSPTASYDPAPTVLAGMDGGGEEPGAAAVAAALAGLLVDRRLGSHATVDVVDVASGTELYQRGGSSPTTPASTMKLATATSVLALRGPAYQIPTRVVAGANPGEVVIIGGGDPTLAATATPTYPGGAKLSDLAAQVRKALGGVAPTKVIVDGSLFTGPSVNPTWDPGTVPGTGIANVTALMTDGARVNPRKTGTTTRYTSPDLAAGQIFAHLLGLPSSAVARGHAPTDSGAAAATSGALAAGTQLGEVLSPPLSRILDVMLSTSDNMLAEMMLRQVALAAHQPVSFAGGTRAVRATLTGLGVPLAGAVFMDGSGLSKKDRLTPRLLTAILTVASRADHPNLHALYAGLPVAGYSGTLAYRYRTSVGFPMSGAGIVRAKSGTLNGVNALAGVVVDAGGRLLAFALMCDRVTSGYEGAVPVLDEMAAALAGLR